MKKSLLVISSLIMMSGCGDVDTRCQSFSVQDLLKKRYALAIKESQKQPSLAQQVLQRHNQKNHPGLEEKIVGFRSQLTTANHISLSNTQVLKHPEEGDTTRRYHCSATLGVDLPSKAAEEKASRLGFDVNDGRVEHTVDYQSWTEEEDFISLQLELPRLVPMMIGIIVNSEPPSSGSAQPESEPALDE